MSSASSDKNLYYLNKHAKSDAFEQPQSMGKKVDDIQQTMETLCPIVKRCKQGMMFG